MMKETKMDRYISVERLKKVLTTENFCADCPNLDEPGGGCPECIADYFDVFLAFPAADDAPERTRWVPVEEHTPKNRYLLCTDGDVTFVAMLSSIDGTWRSVNWGLCRHPTHWMLLPKPPEVKP